MVFLQPSPFTRETAFLMGKPNVWADTSEGWMISPRELANYMRSWIEWYPEKILFGTDLYAATPEIGWEEVGWQTSQGARWALAEALTGMIRCYTREAGVRNLEREIADRFSAVPFDVEDVFWSHRGELCTFDVMVEEPPIANHPLFALENVTFTPHTAGPTWDNWFKAFRNAFDNVQRVARGDRPLWVIPELRQ